MEFLQPRWLVYALAGLVLWGLWGTFSELATAHIDAESALVYKIAGSLLVGLIVLLMLDFAPAANQIGASYAFLSGVVGGVGGLLFLFALRTGPSSLVVPITGLYPIVTVVIGILFLDEVITATEGLGIALAMAAIYLFHV